MFGQVVVGPPGSGKSTFCHAMSEFLRAVNRKAAVVNLDPANEYPPYATCQVDIRHLIDVSHVANLLNLGPNGSLVYCIDFLEHNFDWLLNKIRRLDTSIDRFEYVIIDFPGQVELSTHKACLKNILSRLEKEANLRLVTLHLIDVHYCTDAAKFIAVLLTSLNTMLRLETPHLNILSKMDLFQQFEDKMPFNIDYFCEVLDLKYLVDAMDDDPFMKKFKNFNKTLCETIESYGLVGFIPLNIQDKFSMSNVLREADKANGFCFHELQQRQLAELQQPET